MKRPRDALDMPAASSPPTKRQSLPGLDSPTIMSTFPRPRRSQWASSVPHDSPSNPFGLNRSLRALALPRPTGFAKHAVLRMQVVSHIENRSRSRRIASEAPYRIVQVPLSYSFRLLHELILFLFASDARLHVRRPRRVFSPSPYPHQPPPPPRKAKSDLEVFGESPKAKEEGHLFEVLHGISVYANTYRPGVIKPGSGKLYARLSSARERTLFPEGYEDEDEADNVFGSAPFRPPTETDSDDEEEWDWEGEDDFALGTVWSDGLDLKKAIIYHHTPSTSVHITIYQGRFADRRGSGNTPYVFSAHGGTNGAVRIFNIVSGPMPSEKEIKENMEVASRSRKRKTAKEKKSIFAALADDFDEIDDLDDGEEATDQQLERWNDHDAFQRFLSREAARERAMRKHLDGPQTPVPASSSQHARSNVLIPSRSVPSGSSSHSYASRAHPSHPSHPYAHTHASSDPSSSTSTLAPSSPSTLPIVLPSSDFDGDGEAWSDLDFDPDPSSEEAESDTVTYRGAPVYEIALPVQTPFPANPRVRRRVARVYRRIERQTSKGLSEMSGDEDEDGKGKGDDDEDEQKDELESSQESQQSEGGRDQVREREESEELTEKRPVIAAQGPDVFAAPTAQPVFGYGAYQYDDEEHAQQKRAVDEEDSDDDFWEDGVMEFVTVDDDSADELY